MRTLRRTIVAVALAAVATRPVDAQDTTRAVPDTRPTIAVVDFTNGAIGTRHAEMEPLRMGIADLLITELGANAKVRVVERTQLKAAMAELQLGQGATVDAGTAVRIGRLLNAHHIVTGVFVTDARGRLRIDTRTFRVETSEIEHTTSVRGKTDDVLDLVERLGGAMNAGLALPAIEVRAQGTARPQRAVPFQAVMLYSRALQALDRKDKAEAIQLFRASLDKFPDYEAAKRQLARIESETKAGA
jgi:TolB-like protein